MQTALKSWPDNSNESFVALSICTSFHLILQSLKLSLKHLQPKWSLVNGQKETNVAPRTCGRCERRVGYNSHYGLSFFLLPSTCRPHRQRYSRSLFNIWVLVCGTIIYLDNVTRKITCLENFKHSVKKLPSLDFMHCNFFSTIGSF